LCMSVRILLHKSFVVLNCFELRLWHFMSSFFFGSQSSMFFFWSRWSRIFQQNFKTSIHSYVHVSLYKQLDNVQYLSLTKFFEYFFEKLKKVDQAAETTILNVIEKIRIRKNFSKFLIINSINLINNYYLWKRWRVHYNSHHMMAALIFGYS